MTTRELFDFITDPNINDQNIDVYLERAQHIAANRTDQHLEDEHKVDEEVFKKVYIPQRLQEVTDFENDVLKGNKKEVFYKTITSLKADLTGPTLIPSILDNNESSNESDNSSDDNSSESDAADKKGFVNSSRPKNETTDERKLRKTALKEEKREKRKNKMPKHVKKRKERLGKNPQKN